MTITALPDAPSRTSGPDTFAEDADAFVAALPLLVTEINAETVVIEGHKNDAETAKTAAETARGLAEQAVLDSQAQVNLAAAQVDLAEVQVALAQSAAAYKGTWASRTGAATMPYNVFHLGLFWALNENIADVTAEEPGTSTKWTPTTPAGHILKGMFDGGTPIQGWSGFKVITTFDDPSAGDVTETIKNPSDVTFATRLTEFNTPTAGDITITTTCSVFSISTTEVFTFDDPGAGDITNTITEA